MRRRGLIGPSPDRTGRLAYYVVRVIFFAFKPSVFAL